MAPSIIGNDAVQGEVFLPEQIFVFSGFALRANSLGHLDQISMDVGCVVQVSKSDLMARV